MLRSDAPARHRQRLLLLLVPLLAALLTSSSALAQPSNDDWTAAVVIPAALPYSDDLSTFDATRAFTDPPCFAEERSVWYVYQATQDIRLDANTFGSNYDTTLSAYRGTPSEANQLACNDDAQGLQSQIRIDVANGETIYFMVATYRNETGRNLSFEVAEAPPPLFVDLEIDEQGFTSTVTGTATLRGLVHCSVPTPIDLSGRLIQQVGPVHVFRGTFAQSLASCFGSVPWQADVLANGPYNPGLAGAEATARYFDPDLEQIVEVDTGGLVSLEAVLIPEPGRELLALAGLVALAWLRGRRRTGSGGRPSRA